MSVYYNEFDKGKAAWLRELIRRNVIAPGEVDERSIHLVRPDDLRGFRQCHFFAGIGIWSYALRQAGWPDDREVWTGSCPCQPFSAAGQRKGKADERHLWPEFFRLIEARRPVECFGEQVASSDGLAWFDDVHLNLGSIGYTIGAAITPACGYGAPHRRERLYFVAVADRGGREVQPQRNGYPASDSTVRDSCGPDTYGCRIVEPVAQPASIGRERRRSSEAGGEPGAVERSERLRDAGEPVGISASKGLARRQSVGGSDGFEQPTVERAGCAVDAVGEPDIIGCDGGSAQRQSEGGPGTGFSISIATERLEHAALPEGTRLGGEREHISRQRGPVNGFWRDAEWIYCRDEKYRAAKPGTFPLAHGAPARVLRLRGYGDGIVAPQAQAFIEAYLGINP